MSEIFRGSTKRDPSFNRGGLEVCVGEVYRGGMLGKCVDVC